MSLRGALPNQFVPETLGRGTADKFIASLGYRRNRPANRPRRKVSGKAGSDADWRR